MDFKLLDRINSPEDFRNFSMEELKELCAEVRAYMVDCCSRNPGHLASSLGAVELIVGMHYVFNTPVDKLVFDVGHQAYAHKILTGRREAFKQNRTREGISGFPKISESIYDAFGVGHSSTSISAALGFAEAARIQGNGTKSVALIGDGALTGGLAFEGMNNAGASGADLLVLLNDNNQSIDMNTGGVHNYLLHITTSPAYNKFKGKIWDSMEGRKSRKIIQRSVRSMKSMLVKKSGGDLFEALGFRYFGPIDGNDIAQVVDTLRKLKDFKGPRVLHCITTKGKGYMPAEADPTSWHAPGKFDPESGERILPSTDIDRYQDVFGQVLLELARMDSRVVGITPAMASGCGMNLLAKEMPSRFFDVGIEEEHAVTFSAGLAAGGMRPFCNIYSSFSQRAYDCIIHDIALQELPVVLCFDRAGLVGEDGPTHHGCFDLAAYRSIPNAIIAAPSDELELKNMMYSALQAEKGPYIIRYPRGSGEGRDWRNSSFEGVECGRGRKIVEGERIAILALGPMVNAAVEAAAMAKEKYGYSPSVFDMRFLKPVDNDILKEAAFGYDDIITIEDGALKGGLFSEVSEYVASYGSKACIHPIGIPDRFIAQGRQSEERKECGLDRDSIAGTIEKILQKE